MGTESQELRHIEHIPIKYGCSGVVAAIIFFQVINRIVARVGHPKTVPDKDAWKWRNLFISWIHAMIILFWDLSCFIKYPELTYDLIEATNVYTYAMVVFSTGYFFHDFYDIASSGHLFKQWEVLAHHVAVNGCFVYNVLTNQCIAYTAVALLAEVNSFFLHSRKLMQMAKMQFTHWLYRCNIHVNLVTFVLGRFGGLVWIVYGIIYEGPRISLFYRCCLSASMIIMWPVNIVLFWRLLKNDILRNRRSKRPASTLPAPSSPTVANGLSYDANSNSKMVLEKNGSIANGVKAHQL